MKGAHSTEPATAPHPLKGTCSSSAALLFASSPLLSYLAVVVMLACPAILCTVAMSAPRSRRSEMKERRRSWGEKGLTFALLLILSRMLRTLWSVMRRPWMAPLRWMGRKKGPGSPPLLTSQASRAAFAPFVACPVLRLPSLPRPDRENARLLVVVREVEGDRL